MIYFDNAATSPPINIPQLFHNPSSPHALGINAERALRDARKKIAAILGSTDPDEVIFTSGGTESNNLAILGYALANSRQNINLISTPHEHPSILAPIKFAYERNWGTPHTKLVIPTTGPALVSISHVNHETGDINDINAIASDIKKIKPGAAIHIDGAQGFGKESVCLQNIDMYSFSGHKFHGPMGVGGLWIKKGIRLTPLQHGGGQENNMRSGTENVPAIVQMAIAAESACQNFTNNHTHVAQLNSIIRNLKSDLKDVTVNNLGGETSPYILNMSFLGVKGEVLVHALSEKGVYVSMGAACRSRKRAKPALELMGFAPEVAQSAIRFSFSPINTIEEATHAREIIFDLVKQFRKLMK